MDFKYNNGLWALEFEESDGNDCDFHVPFASGYGGITVAMMPNGASYDDYCDTDEFAWSTGIDCEKAQGREPRCFDSIAPDFSLIALHEQVILFT